MIADISNNDSLLISIHSFGYQKGGIPVNKYGDGGGYVFDCRFLPNPHHDPNLREFTGKDKSIKDFFSDYPPIDVFIEDCIAMVKNSAEVYTEIGYANLQVSFGCTGGKHRSVYCAERTYEELSKIGYQVKLFHQEL